METENGEKAHKALDETCILFEDETILVINKPSGIIVHSDGRNRETSVVDWFLTRVPEARGVGEPGFSPQGVLLERSGVVHRIDRETSGVLVLAKTQSAFEHLKHQFHDHLVRKEYRAFVYGTMKEQWGTIDRPIGRSATDFRLRSAQRGARGMLRPAITNWELIGQNETCAYLRLFPKTGRTHQLRVHLKAIGRPILMDPLYAPEQLRKGENLEFSRLALHAYSLRINNPSGEEMTYIAPFPLDFEIAAAHLEQ